MKAKTGYTLSIPTETYRNLKKLAEQEDTTIAELLRRAIRWYLFIQTTKLDPDARLLVDQGGETREIIIDLV